VFACIYKLHIVTATKKLSVSANGDKLILLCFHRSVGYFEKYDLVHIFVEKSTLDLYSPPPVTWSMELYANIFTMFLNVRMSLPLDLTACKFISSIVELGLITTFAVGKRNPVALTF